MAMVKNVWLILLEIILYKFTQQPNNYNQQRSTTPEYTR